MSEPLPVQSVLAERAGREVVICVDDDALILASLKRLLRDEPYELLLSTRPQEALEWIKSREIDILIADQRMAGMNGIGLFKTVQAVSPRTRRMMLTAYPDPDVMAEAINDAQIDRFMQKPWDEETLKRTIRTLLGEHNKDQGDGREDASLASEKSLPSPQARMVDSPGYQKVLSVFETTRIAPEGHKEPIVLQNDIAILSPEPLAQGAFGQVYLGKILNPIGLLAERVIWREEDPALLGLDPRLFETPEKDSDSKKPITDPNSRGQVYQAAQKLWNSYLERRNRDRTQANEEYLELLNLIDPLLVEDRLIAVKVLHRSGSESEADAPSTKNELVRRFIKENEILRRLRHPNIVRRFGLVQDSQLGWCMILEYVDGLTLDEVKAGYPDGRLPLDFALRKAAELVSALEYTQAQGVIHRDLKPQNIMIRSGDSRVVLMDFGIGKWTDDTMTEAITIPGSRIGTPRYMAPEQVNEGGTASLATDIYQLSTLLFELVTGHAAYEGMQLEDLVLWLGDRKRGHPFYLRDLVRDIPAEVECLIEVGRDKDPEKRWTIREFREKLEGILGAGLPVGLPRRLPDSLEALDRDLQGARRRKKEAQWEERLLETQLRLVSLKSRFEEVRALLRQGRHEEAGQLVASLSQEVVDRTPRYKALVEELSQLKSEVELDGARCDLEQLLRRAESEFLAGRYPEVGAALDTMRERLKILPESAVPELRERYRKLQEPYDARHRAFVDLFNTVKKSFVGKLREDLKSACAARPSPPRQVLNDILRELETAEKNLGGIERAKVGVEALESLQLELSELRSILQALSTPTAGGGPGSPPIGSRPLGGTGEQSSV